MRGHGREAREEGRVHGRRQPGVEAVLRVGAGRRHGAERASAAAATRGGGRRSRWRRLLLRRLLGRRRLLLLGRRRRGLGLGRRRRGLHGPGGAEAGQRRRRRGAASPAASRGSPAPAAAARERQVRALQAAESARAERPAGQEVAGAVEQRVVGRLHGVRRGVHRRRRGGQARIGGLGSAALARGRGLARAARASVAAPRGCGRRGLELRERGQVGRALPRGEVLRRREALRVREAELLPLLMARSEWRRLERRAGRRRRRAEPARAVERRRLRVRRVGKAGRAELFPLLAAQLLLLPLTEVLRGGGAAATAGGGGGGGGVVQTRFEVLGGEEVGHTRVRAAAGAVVGEFLRGHRPLCQPRQQLILHGLLMDQERGGRGSGGGPAARAAAAEGERGGGGGLREPGDRQRRRRERAEGRGGG